MTNISVIKLPNGNSHEIEDTAARSLANEALEVAHTHSNKSILDSLQQSSITGTAVAQAIADDHTHSNKSLLDSYTQTETNLADAVSKKHEHDNKDILDAIEEAPLYASLKGANNGLAELDANGKVPATQLPSYVDDVVEVATYGDLPATGEAGKIYVTKDTNKTYRWSGSAYVEISASLALGETESTAYRGDRGKIAYEHSIDANVHVTAAQKTAWTNKQDALVFGTAYDATSNKAATLADIESAIGAAIEEAY